MIDYSEVNKHLRSALAHMASATSAAGQINLPPTMAPPDAHAQIDAVAELLRRAENEITRATGRLAAAGRDGLTVVK